MHLLQLQSMNSDSDAWCTKNWQNAEWCAKPVSRPGMRCCHILCQIDLMSGNVWQAAVLADSTILPRASLPFCYPLVQEDRVWTWQGQTLSSYMMLISTLRSTAKLKTDAIGLAKLSQFMCIAWWARQSACVVNHQSCHKSFCRRVYHATKLLDLPFWSECMLSDTVVQMSFKQRRCAFIWHQPRCYIAVLGHKGHSRWGHTCLGQAKTQAGCCCPGGHYSWQPEQAKHCCYRRCANGATAAVFNCRDWHKKASARKWTTKYCNCYWLNVTQQIQSHLRVITVWCL